MEKVQNNETYTSREKITSLVKNILNQAIDGTGPLKGAEKLAADYLQNRGTRSTDQLVDSLVRWESSRNFGTGFLTGLGGAVTLPVSIPASIYASWLVQTRMAGAIACLYGYTLTDERVRTFVLLSLMGSAAKQVIRELGVDAARKITTSAIKKIPSRLLRDLNEKIGIRLLSHTGEKGGINLLRLAPVMGGFVGGVADSMESYIVGRTAKRIFSSGGYAREMGISQLQFDMEHLSTILSQNSRYIKQVIMPEDNRIDIILKRIPVVIRVQYVRFHQGTIYFRILGNGVKRAIVKAGIRKVTGSLPSSIKEEFTINENMFMVYLNRLISETFTSVEGIEVTDMDFSGNTLRIYL